MHTHANPLSLEQIEKLLSIVEKRFTQHMHRHESMQRSDVQSKLDAHPQKLRSLRQMEDTGGEPDVIGYDPKEGVYIFCDCAPESPAGRRSLCYDRDAREARKQHKPKGNALDTAAALGIELLTEDQYRDLQRLEKVDQKTSSRIQTPAEIRKLGGALFCDRRYDQVFTYHNGADSYYAARGFRGALRV